MHLCRLTWRLFNRLQTIQETSACPDHVAAHDSAWMAWSCYCCTNQAAPSPLHINSWGYRQTFPKALHHRDQSPATSDQFLKRTQNVPLTCSGEAHDSPAHDLNVVEGEQGQNLQKQKEKLWPHHPISNVKLTVHSKCIYCMLLYSQHGTHNKTNQWKHEGSRFNSIKKPVKCIGCTSCTLIIKRQLSLIIQDNINSISIIYILL